MQQYDGHQHCIVTCWADFKTVKIPDMYAPISLAAVCKQAAMEVP